MNLLKKILLSRQAIGKQAEETACQFLAAKGFRLIEKNYRCAYGEIDLIMHDQDDIVFIEVRSRSRVDFGSASQSVNKKKQKKLIYTAKHFLQKRKCLYKVNSRFDIVGIHYSLGKLEFEWIRNAFSVESNT